MERGKRRQNTLLHKPPPPTPTIATFFYIFYFLFFPGALPLDYFLSYFTIKKERFVVRGEEEEIKWLHVEVNSEVYSKDWWVWKVKETPVNYVQKNKRKRLRWRQMRKRRRRNIWCLKICKALGGGGRRRGILNEGAKRYVGKIYW